MKGVNGKVEDWVQLTRNEAYYGSDYCGGIVCAQTWVFVRDAPTVLTPHDRDLRTVFERWGDPPGPPHFLCPPHPGALPGLSTRLRKDRAPVATRNPGPA